MLCNLLLYLIILFVLVNSFGETWFLFFLLKGRCGPSGVTQLELLQNLAQLTLVYEETNFSELWKNTMEFDGRVIHTSSARKNSIGSIKKTFIRAQ